MKPAGFIRQIAAARCSIKRWPKWMQRNARFAVAKSDAIRALPDKENGNAE